MSQPKTFVEAIERLRALATACKEIEATCSGALKDPRIGYRHRDDVQKLQETFSILGNHVGEIAAGVATLATAHSNEPIDKIMEALSK